VGLFSDEQMANRVNSWTQWGELEEVVVGRADNGCFPPDEPNYPSTMHPTWPLGRKSKHSIQLANNELQNLQEILEAERISVISKVRMLVNL
jgi:glycine amidinotransferase